MRFITVAGVVAMFLMVCFSPCKVSAGEFVQISEPFVNVYEFLDPKSTVIKMVKKGDRLELIYAGTSWYQVKVRDKIGWVERKAGSIVEGTNIFSPLLSIIICLLVLSGTIYGVAFYIKKQKAIDTDLV